MQASFSLFKKRPSNFASPLIVSGISGSTLQHTAIRIATHCNTHCSTLQPHCNVMYHTATHCNAYCNTLQRQETELDDISIPLTAALQPHTQPALATTTAATPLRE